MIRGLHGLFYSTKADEARAFMRDKLRLPFTDVGGGWLIFDLPEADVGVHPVDSSDGRGPTKHDVSFYCDDIRGTMADLRKRGVEFTQEAADHRYGWVTYFEMPGGILVQLYEPKYQKRASKAAARSAPKRTRKTASARKSKPAKRAAKPAKSKSKSRR